MPAWAVDFTVVIAPLTGGLFAVLAIRLAVARASLREQVRIRQLLKSFDGP